LKQLIDKENIYEYSADKVHAIISSTKGSYNRLIRAIEHKNLSWPPSPKMVHKICDAVDLYGQSPLLIYGESQTFALWIQYFDRWVKEIKEDIYKILLSIHFLDSQLTRLILKIDACSFFEKVEEAVVGTIKYKKLLFIEKELYQYFTLVGDLERYYNNHLIDYRFTNKNHKGGNMGFIQRKKLTPSNLIQLLIFGGILVTCIMTGIMIRKQSIYNENIMRPWIYCKIDTIRGIQPIEISKSGDIRFNHFLVNIGSTPACNLRAYSVLDPNPEFPVANFKQQITESTNPRRIFLFPGQKELFISSILICHADTYISDSIEIRSKDAIIELFKKFNMHAHIYLEYYDSSNNKYALRSTFYAKFLEESDGSISIQFFTTYNSDELIN
jgi:hypothetical protein